LWGHYTWKGPFAARFFFFNILATILILQRVRPPPIEGKNGCKLELTTSVAWLLETGTDPPPLTVNKVDLKIDNHRSKTTKMIYIIMVFKQLKMVSSFEITGDWRFFENSNSHTNPPYKDSALYPICNEFQCSFLLYLKVLNPHKRICFQ
jgi:hypothetical protein